jgi:hypothetical protein
MGDPQKKYEYNVDSYIVQSPVPENYLKMFVCSKFYPVQVSVAGRLCTRNTSRGHICVLFNVLVCGFIYKGRESRRSMSSSCEKETCVVALTSAVHSRKFCRDPVLSVCYEGLVLKNNQNFIS